MIPDYPPPSFQEAIRTPPFIPPPVVEPVPEQPPSPMSVADPNPDTSSPPPANEDIPLSPPAEVPQPPLLTVQTAVGPSGSPSESPSSQQTADPSSHSSGSDEFSSTSSSLEIVNFENGSGSWEEERQRGVRLSVRARNEERRLLMAESKTNLVSGHQASSSRCETPNSHFATVDSRCGHCGSPKGQSSRDHPLPTSSPDLTDKKLSNQSALATLLKPPNNRE